jgi:plastocyanin
MKRDSISPLQPSIFALLALLAGCGGGGDGGTPPPTTTIAKTSTNSGDGQSATVGLALDAPLQVLVNDQGSPSAGTTVTWSTTSGSLAPASSATDANGVASSAWTLGTVSGTQTATATLSGASGSPVTFTATAAPDVATTLSKSAGDNQTGEINALLAAPVQAKVADQFGNGVSGVAVAWAATGAAVSAPTVNTDASGLSPVTVTLGGVAGPITITATADGLTGSPLTFNATATVPPPIPTTAAVTISNILFRSNHNATVNPAVDTVAVGGTVTWTWVNTNTTPHSVMSTGSPSFTSSSLMTGNGQTYVFTFGTAGTYQYTCAEHPGQMTGRVVVR